MTCTLKTISQIESETKNVESCMDETKLARMIALVGFLKETEIKHGCNFTIISACPQISENRHWLSTERGKRFFTLGTWARVSLNGVEHLIDTKLISFSNKAYNASQETVNEIIEDLKVMLADTIAFK